MKCTFYYNLKVQKTFVEITQKVRSVAVWYTVPYINLRLPCLLHEYFIEFLSCTGTRSVGCEFAINHFRSAKIFSSLAASLPLIQTFHSSAFIFLHKIRIRSWLILLNWLDFLFSPQSSRHNFFTIFVHASSTYRRSTNNFAPSEIPSGNLTIM